jgi:hypothetical protein
MAPLHPSSTAISIPPHLLFETPLKPQVRDTLLQLMALAWEQPGGRLPPLNLFDLSLSTGKGDGVLRRHLAALCAAGLLDVQPGPGGRLLICLDPGLSGAPAPVESEEQIETQNVSQNVFKEEELVKTYACLQTLLLKGPRSAQNVPSKRSVLPRPRRLPKAVCEALLAAGVYPALLDEVARSAYSPAELEALLAWCVHDQPDCPARLFIGRMRLKAIPPRVYSRPACPRCGQRGGHRPDCPERFTGGAFAAYLEHE